MQRKDLTTHIVLSAHVRGHGDDPFGYYKLVTLGAPEKVVWAAIMREVDHGHLEYGSSARYAWLTPKGIETLASLEAQPKPIT